MQPLPHQQTSMTAQSSKQTSAISSSSSQSSLFPNLVPDVIPLVLAATIGTRMFPLTSSPSNPKHALPVGGISLLERILLLLAQSNFTECLVAVACEDAVTLPTILQPHVVVDHKTISSSTTTATDTSSSFRVLELDFTGMKLSPKDMNTSTSSNKRLKVTLIPVPEECGGSAEAVRWIEQQQQQQQDRNDARLFLPVSSHLLIVPGDLVLLDPTLLRQMVDEHVQQHMRAGIISDSPHAHIPTPPPACTMLLVSVGEQDEHGIPLKESAKQKKGGFYRDDDAIEYIALCRTHNPPGPRPATTTSTRPLPPRVIWKQSKAAVEEDEDQVGSTPKLVLPKPRLRIPAGGNVQIRTDWNDVHVYLLAPWVRCLLQKRTSLSSIHEDLIPLLVSRQYQGVRTTFQQQHAKRQAQALEEDTELMEQLYQAASPSFMKMGKNNFLHSPAINTSSTGNNPLQSRHEDDEDRLAGLNSVHSNMDTSGNAKSTGRRSLLATWLKQPYAVSAVVGESPRPAALRACTIPWYLYANRELVLQHIAGSLAPPSSHAKTQGAAVAFPEQTQLHGKFQSIILPNTTMGEKATFKSVSIGRNCKIGSKCKLNNVVIMDDVILGDNCLLQNCVVGTSSKLGDGCHLNDCQVSPQTVVASGTKEKGEALVSDDQDDDEHGGDGAAFLSSDAMDADMDF